MIERAQVLDGRRAALGLTLFLVGQLVGFVAWQVFERLVIAEVISSSAFVFRAAGVIDAGFDVLSTIGLFVVASAVRPTHLATIAGWTWAVATIAFLAMGFWPGESTSTATFVHPVLALAMKATVSVLLLQLAAWRYRWLAPVVLGALAVAALSALFRMFLSYEVFVVNDRSFSELSTRAAPILGLVSWAGLIVTAGTVFMARLAVLETPTSAAAKEWTSGSSPTQDLVVGGIALAVALVVTVGSIVYRAGGGVIVTTGLFVFGVVRLVRGFRSR